MILTYNYETWDDLYQSRNKKIRIVQRGMSKNWKGKEGLPSRLLTTPSLDDHCLLCSLSGQPDLLIGSQGSYLCSPFIIPTNMPWSFSESLWEARNSFFS